MELADLTRVIAPTLSRQLFMMARQFEDVVDFTLGDPDVPTPLPICEAAANAARAGLLDMHRMLGCLPCAKLSLSRSQMR